MTHVLDALGRIKEYWGSVALADLDDYARGRIIRGGAADWEGYAAETAGAVLIGDGVDVISDTTPTFVGLTTHNAGIVVGTGQDIDPTDASGQDLGDATHRWDLYTQEVYFGGASGANATTILDNVADPWHLSDAGGLEYVRVNSQNANPYFLIDPASAGINVGISDPTPTYMLSMAETISNVDDRMVAIIGSVTGVLTASRESMGLWLDITSNATEGIHDQNVIGIYSVLKSTDTFNLNHAWAFYNVCNNYASTTDDQRGVYNLMTNRTTGTVNAAYGTHNYIRNIAAGGTIVDAYGSYNRIRVSVGTITNAYGVYVYIQGAPGTSYGIYATGEQRNYLSGLLSVGGPVAPLAQLHVDQSAAGGNIPALLLDQADLSDEFIDFVCATTGAGDPVDTVTAVGANFARLRVAVNGVFKYVQLYNA